ncbi:MAG: patatin-like phospholipase family protein [Desulfotomaculum sp.]|nr:patatin-like phospholipase family protein [Desulfotomaculum sp.]
MTKYRIIAFDGGGVRGVLTVNILKRLNKIFPDLINSVNLFAGTSTGSFIALALAYGLNVDELVNMYTIERARYIFSPRNILLFKPKYNNVHLRQVLEGMFPADLRLKDLKRSVIIPSFRVNTRSSTRWEPVFFNNFPGSDTKNEYVIDVALASSAAPIYFPSHHNYIDGGVVSNNPSVAAIAAAVDKKAGRQKLEDIHLLSIGTGYIPHKINKSTQRWGALQWMLNPNPHFPLLSVLFDGDVEADSLIASQFLVNRYFRVNPMLKEVIHLDEYSKIPQLITLARMYNVKTAVKWIKKYWF